MATIPLDHTHKNADWILPSRGKAGMYSLIAAETAMFSIFIVAYVYYVGRSLYGPQPKDVLELPILDSILLWGSSLTIWFSERALRSRNMQAFKALWGLTILLGSIFLLGTAREWKKLIFEDGLKINTNLFGTTFYSLVGLHATHVVVGLIMLITVWVCAMLGKVEPQHTDKIETLALYWHFVDAVWVVVFLVVYVFGR